MLSLAFAGCAVDTGVILPGDAEADDAAADSAEPPADGGRDSGVDGGADSSTPPQDSGVEDGGAADTAVRDSSSPPDAGPDSSPGPGFCDTADPALELCVRFEDALVDEAGSRAFRAFGHGFADGRVGRGLVHPEGASVWVDDVGGLSALPVTFELWFRPSALPSSGRAGIADFDGAFGIFVYPDGRVACKTSEEAPSLPATAVIGRWTHVTCVFEVGTMRTYIDGAEAATSASSYVGGDTGLGIRFSGNSPSGQDFEGRLDEARFFSDVRTPAEVAAAAAR